MVIFRGIPMENKKDSYRETLKKDLKEKIK